MLKRFLPGNGHHNETPASYFSAPNESLAPPSSRVATPSYLYSPTLSHEPVNGYFDYPLNQSNAQPSRAGTPLVSRATSPIPPLSRNSMPSPFMNEEYLSRQPNPTPARSGSIERSTMLKSMKTIESLVESFSQLNDIQQILNKCQKKIIKGCKDLANLLTEDNMSKEDIAENVLINTLLCASCFFESLHEVTTKTSKTTEKEYKNMEEVVMKAFKKIVKEERAHDEHLETLEAKIQKANNAFDKHRKPPKRGISLSSGDSHEGAVAADRYYSSISSLGLDVSKAKSAHSGIMHSRRESLCRILCKSVFQIAENEWKNSCEEVRRAGLVIGKMTMWANFCTHDGMPKKIPESIQSEDRSSGLRIQISPQNMPDPTAIYHANQSHKPEDGKEIIVYGESRLTTDTNHTSALSSPAMMQASSTPSPSAMYATPGLGLARSPSKTMGHRTLPAPLPSPSLHTSCNFSVQSAVNSNPLPPHHQEEAKNMLVRQTSPWAPAPNDVGPNSIATAPLIVRKTPRQSQEGTSHRAEETIADSARQDLSAYHNGVSSQLIHILNSQNASNFEAPNSMTSNQLATIKGHHRVIDSQQAAVEMTRIPDSHQQFFSDQPQSRVVPPFLELSDNHPIPDTRVRNTDRATLQTNSQDQSKRSELKENEIVAQKSVVATNPNVIEFSDSQNSVENSSILERQISSASGDSTKSNVMKMKEVFLPPHNRSDTENLTSASFSPIISTPVSPDPSHAHGNSVAALASHFSALTDPYLRQSEPRQLTEVESSFRRVASPPLILQRSRPYAHQRLSMGVGNLVMKPNRHLSTGHPPLMPNRTLTQPADHQNIRLYSQQMKNRENSQGS